MSQTDIQRELRNPPAAEPLLPIEKKLIGWSLGTGLVLLALLRSSTTSPRQAYALGQPRSRLRGAVRSSSPAAGSSAGILQRLVGEGHPVGSEIDEFCYLPPIAFWRENPSING